LVGERRALINQLRAILLERGFIAPQGKLEQFLAMLRAEDRRDLRRSAADRSAAELYAAMIAPSGARPSVTKRRNHAAWLPSGW
jgi:hypothetical protein